jgi:hypothetical protein
VTADVVTAGARDLDTRGGHALSVVVVPIGGSEYLEACLGALEAQAEPGRVEIVVPFDDGLDIGGGLETRFPFARFAYVAGRHSAAALRTEGVRRAVGRIVAITEDAVEPATDWCERLISAHERAVCAVGGAVDREIGPDVSSAIFLADYDRYRPPLAEGPTVALTDINSSYKRWALELVADVWRVEFHENEVNGSLLAGGGCLWLAPAVLVRHRRRLSSREALRDRYEFGRLFASSRLRGAPLVRRAVYVLFSFVLPLVIVERVVARYLRGGRRLSELLRVLPSLALVAVAWAYGELLGYLTGKSANSPDSERNAQGNPV